MTTARRLMLLGVVVLIAIATAAGYTWSAIQRTSGDTTPKATPPGPAMTLQEVLQGPHVVFQDSTAGATWGRAAVVPLGAPTAARSRTTTSCERLYSVGNVGLCLAAKRGVVTRYKAVSLDASLRPGRSLPIEGEPSRVRLSADGRLAATTTFTTGHSYLSSGFSTVTTIYDMTTVKEMHNLEEFAITRDGKPYRSVDVNLWGVTFKRDGDGFYATMASRGTIYLVEGSVRARTLRTIKRDVECPSLSPDGKRIAYKKRDTRSGFEGWRLRILDLESGADHALAETRSVDDQVEWLDDKRVLYGMLRDGRFLESDVWVVPADGGGTGRVFIRDARSPAVVRDPD